MRKCDVFKDDIVGADRLDQRRETGTWRDCLDRVDRFVRKRTIEDFPGRSIVEPFARMEGL